MVSLEETRTSTNLKLRFSDEGRFDRLYGSDEEAARAFALAAKPGARVNESTE